MSAPKGAETGHKFTIVAVGNVQHTVGHRPSQSLLGILEQSIVAHIAQLDLVLGKLLLG